MPIRNTLKLYGEWDIKLTLKKNDYSLFKRKILRRISLIILVTGILLFILQSLARGVAGNWGVAVLVEHFNFTQEMAFYVHDNLIRRNLTIIMIVVAIGAIVIIFRIYTNFVTNYFDEIANGMDKLIEETEGSIELSLEMKSIESKMNQVNQIIKKRERDAKEAEQRKNDLVVYLAHDIRTPLTSIVGYLNLLQETSESLPQEQQAKYVQLTLDKSYRLEGLINEFFDITRFNLQEIVLSKQPIDLRLLAEQAADEFYINGQARGQEIVIDGMTRLVVSADPDKLGRVFTNLMKNALAYSFEQTPIEITIARTESDAIIRFKNQGPDIPEEMQGAVFDKFYRIDNSRSSQTGGSGLGLSISKEIVLAHKGDIQLRSKDNQTLFEIHLPID